MEKWLRTQSPHFEDPMQALTMSVAERLRYIGYIPATPFSPSNEVHRWVRSFYTNLNTYLPAVSRESYPLLDSLSWVLASEV